MSARADFKVDLQFFWRARSPVDVARQIQVRGRKIWLHVEGVFFRRPPHEVDNDDVETARWESLIGRVMRLVTRSEKEAASTADHIARWIGVLASENDSPEQKQLLDVVADGVRSDRHENPNGGRV